MMFTIYILVAVAFGSMALIFIWGRPALAVTFFAIAIFGLAPLFQASDGIPAHADGRLAAEQWKLLGVAPLPDNVFIVTLKFAGDDIRTYRLVLPSGQQRDKFLEAQRGLKAGKTMMGKARKGRAGLMDDSEMDFDFVEAPQATKEGSPP